MIWNVDPVLLRIGFFELRYYSLMFILGFFLMTAYVKTIFKKNGRDPELVSTLTSYIIVGMLIGARLGHCLFYEPEYYLAHPLEILKVWEGGLASHGGYLGVMISVYAFIKKNPTIKFLWLTDVLAGPCLFVGGLIRIGNFFNSEIFGGPTNLPWAVVFERVDMIPRHPAQLYESLGYFSVAAFLIFMERSKNGKWPQGSFLALSFILSFTFRFFIEFIKDEQSELVLTDAINMGQWLSLAFVVGGLILLFRVSSQAGFKESKN
jgi:phosphatidylglycerol---prolipoprotein diacylglyceryl transferase